MAKRKPAPNVAESWSRIETWLAAHAKSLGKCLAKGATADQIAKLEKALDAQLPGAWKESLALHNGQKQDGDMIPDDGIGSFYFLTCKDVVEDWKVWNQVQQAGDFDDSKAKPDKGIANCWWNPRWIPFASNSGDNLCLDLAPTSAGKRGQVILVRHDDPHRKLLANSYEAWLDQLADTIESGGIDYLLEG